MAAPGSPVDICNLALDRIGQLPVADILNPTTPTEIICNRHYDETRRECLRSFIFNFARKLAVLQPVTSVTPAFGFTNVYPLPLDFLRLMALGDITSINNDVVSQLYEMSDGYIYCDSGTSLQLDSNGDPIAGQGLDLQYIFDAVTVQKFDPLFIKVLKLRLAANMAYKFSLKQSLVEGLLNELGQVELKAAAVAGQEKPPRRRQRSRARDIRRTGGIYRDYGRYP